jgi:hypothetical protein
VQERRLTAYWGCPSSISRDGLAWLNRVLYLCQWMERVSVHRYNYGEKPDVSASPYGSRAAEMVALKAVIGPRRFRVTEIGCKCGPRIYSTGAWFWKRWHGVTEAEQLAYLKAEVALWKDADGCDIYQECASAVDQYGLNDPAGKPRQAWEVYA